MIPIGYPLIQQQMLSLLTLAADHAPPYRSPSFVANHGHRDMYAGLPKPTRVKSPLPHTYVLKDLVPDLTNFYNQPAASPRAARPPPHGLGASALLHETGRPRCGLVVEVGAEHPPFK